MFDIEQYIDDFIGFVHQLIKYTQTTRHSAAAYRATQRKGTPIMELVHINNALYSRSTYIVI